MKRFHKLVTTLDSLTASGSHRAQQKFSKQQGGQRRQNMTTLKRILNVVSGGDQLAMLEELNAYFSGPESHEATTKRHQHCLEVIRDEFLSASQTEKVKILSFVAKSYPAKYLREIGFEFPLSMHQNAKRWSTQNSLNNRNILSQNTNPSETPNQTENNENEETSESDQVQRSLTLNNENISNQQLPLHQDVHQRLLSNHEMMQGQRSLPLTHEMMQGQRSLPLSHEMMQGQRSPPQNHEIMQGKVTNHEVISNQGSFQNNRAMLNQGMMNQPNNFGNYEIMMGSQMSFPNHMELSNQRTMNPQELMSHQGMIPNQRPLPLNPIDDSPTKPKRKNTKKDSNSTSRAKQTETKGGAKNLKSVDEFIDFNDDEQKKSGKRKRDSNQISYFDSAPSKKQQSLINF